MTITDLYSALSEIDGLDVYTTRAKVGAVLPYCVILFGSSANFEADNITFAKQDTLTIELYTTNKDDSFESAIENVLTKNDLPFETDEGFDDGEQFYIKYYSITRG